ncbi:NTP transferase domain-containing protein [Cognatishimia sp. F0-27]|uniref:nucleotidyltransferase family protein n=1 Tax=Cognatishimia sp. F0-27 TaxID=2816855 RepID=UPI001D0C9259|nr:nucleotidyltransferase family protein [Cognatishimia sp. F0-27]MCC1493346.1 nucleotidyltransferase family protein [Cognatishimia sp. F0-27]
MQDIAILIPAAGSSRRMRGADKLMEPVEGEPLLRRQAKAALAVGAHVSVTLPDPEHPRMEALRGLSVMPVFVPDADEGMAASLRRGVRLLPDGIRAVMILPADMPDLGQAELQIMLDAFRNASRPMLVQGCADDGTPGHPVLFPADCFPALERVIGDTGARSVLKSNINRLAYVPLPGRAALTDLDTPEAWQDWRAGALT